MQKQTIESIIVGVIIAVSIISGVTLLQQKIPSTPSGGHFSSNSQNPNSSTTTGTFRTTSPSPGSSLGETGVLAVQISDPPNVPSGVSSVYISYSGIAVHAAGVANGSGWYSIADSGSLDLLKVVRESITIGSANVTSGVNFNVVQFSILGADVTFNGQNYTAAVPSSKVSLPISNGGVMVEPNSSSGFVIVLSPTVIPLGGGKSGKTSTGFMLLPAGKSIPIPKQDWDGSEETKKGATDQVNNTSWWELQQVEEMTSGISILQANLTNGSALLTVENTGNTNVTLTSVNLFAPKNGGAAGISSSTSSSSTFSNTTESSSFASMAATKTLLNSSIYENSSSSFSYPEYSNSTSSSSSSWTIISESINNSQGYQSISNSSSISGSMSTVSKLDSNIKDYGPIASFAVLSNGTLSQSNATLKTDSSLYFGYELSPNQTAVLSYSGSVFLVSGQDGVFFAPGSSSLLFYSGEPYYVTVTTNYGITAQYLYADRG